MDAIVITSITATPSFAIANSEGYATQPGHPITIWDPTETYEESLGSILPIAFQIPEESLKIYELPIKIDGICTFTTKYSAAEFKIVGFCQDPNKPDQEYQIFSSKAQQLPPIPPDVPPLILPLKIDTMDFLAPFSAFPCPVPFIWNGDFTWKVVCKGGQPDIKFLKNTRLEFCWLRAAASSGPTEVQSELQRSQVDFQGRYPIQLLRIFLPNPTIFPKEAEGANFNKSFRIWYIRHCVKTMWNAVDSTKKQPSFDLDYGESHFEMMPFGGSFSLKEWVEKKKSKVNAFDLSGILQLGYSLLVGSEGDEQLVSSWVFYEPVKGYKPSIWYGYNQPNEEPFDKFPYDCWLEVCVDEDQKIYKVAAATRCQTGEDGPKFDDGKHSEVEYITQSYLSLGVPPKKECITRAIGIGNTPSVGFIYTFPDYSLGPDLQNPDPIKKKGKARIGVYDTYGIMKIPLTSNRTDPGYPVGLENPIQSWIDAGTNPTQPKAGIMNIALSSDILDEVLVKNLELKPDQVVDIRLRAGRTFFSKSYKSGDKDTLVVTVQIFANLNIARMVLWWELSKTQSDKPPQTTNFPLGNVALRTLTSIYVLRNNFIYKTTTANGSLLESSAALLDAYFAKSSLNPPKPSPFEVELVANTKDMVLKVGEARELKIQDWDSYINESSIELEGQNKVICKGPADRNGTFVLWGLDKGVATVYIAAADKKTLQPRYQVFKIKIV